VPDLLLECEFLADLKSKELVVAALKYGYHILLRDGVLPSLECTGELSECRISGHRTDDATIYFQDLKEFLVVHSRTLERTAKDCLARSLNLAMDSEEDKAALGRLAMDDDRLSIMLLRSLEQNRAVLRRCVSSMHHRMSSVLVWLEQAKLL